MVMMMTVAALPVACMGRAAIPAASGKCGTTAESGDRSRAGNGTGTEGAADGRTRTEATSANRRAATPKGMTAADMDAARPAAAEYTRPPATSATAPATETPSIWAAIDTE